MEQTKLIVFLRTSSMRRTSESKQIRGVPGLIDKVLKILKSILKTIFIKYGIVCLQEAIFLRQSRE